jgi:hypothetical protein
MWFVGITLIILVAIWVYEFSSHSTPQKAQAVYDSTVRPFETIPFAKGVVLLTPIAQGNGFIAWYMKKGFWGWQVSAISNALVDLAPQNYNGDFQTFSYDGETFVWGTAMTPIDKIIYRHNEETYTCKVRQPVWYMILPFSQTLFPHSEWTMVLDNGKTAPLFK